MPLLQDRLMLNMLIQNENKEKLRVLWISKNSDDIYVINVNDNRWQYLYSKSELKTEINKGKAVIVDDFTFILSEDDISDKNKQIRDKYFNVISELYKLIDEPEIFTKERNKYIVKLSYEHKIARSSIEGALKRYWKGGKTKNSLLPHYYKCGGKGKEKLAGKVKRGRPPIYKQHEGINVDENIKKIFKQSISKFYNTKKQNSLVTAYELMLKEYFSADVVDSNGNKKLILNSKKEIPTIAQFRYWFNRERDIKKEIVSRKGSRIFEQKHRAILNSSNKGILGPGMQYQIDATIGDIYLVSEYNSKWIIGRPVIYMVMDTFSRMITGFYVGLEGPNWIGAMTALSNAMTSKVEFCKEYGVDIEDYEWPCKNVPFSILADRGELVGFQADNLVNNLGIQLSNTPPYRAEWKAVIEQNFRCINQNVKPLAPAVVLPDFRERGAKDYRLEAKLTLKEFTKIIINIILHHNNKHVLKHYVRDKEMIKDDVELIPQKIWNWGMKNRTGVLKTLDSQTIKFALMPRDEATITEKGIRFKGIYYSSLLAIKERIFEKARLNGKYKIKILYDPRNMNNIYWILDEHMKYEKCFLLNREYRYLDMCIEEIQYLQKREIMMVNKCESDEIEEKINLINSIEEIANKQYIHSNLNNKDLKGIRANRATEKIMNRKAEAFTLEEQSNVVVNNEKKEGVALDDLELIKSKLRRLNNE